MTRKLLASAVALLCVGTATANYPAATIPFDTTLDCTSCIRGGYDFCLRVNVDTVTKATVTSWDCNKDAQVPEAKNGTGGLGAGYICSGYFSDQMNAIVNGCRPYLPENRDDNCGNYLVDISKNTYDSRSIKELAVNTSCTYRVYTTCGYPSAWGRTQNVTVAGDFDVAYAYVNGMGLEDDLNGWNNTLTTRAQGAFQSGSAQATDTLTEGNTDAVKIPDDLFTGCNGTQRNMWITVTRTKVSSPPKLESEFLETESRSLQGMLRFYDFEIYFENVQGGPDFGTVLKVASVAVVAVLSVFAF